MQIREEPPPYSSPDHQRYGSFENPLAGPGSDSFDDGRVSSGNPQSGTALYDFTAGGDDEVSWIELYLELMSLLVTCEVLFLLVIQVRDVCFCFSIWLMLEFALLAA